MTLKLPNTTDERIFEQALSWFIALQDEACGDHKCQRFQSWINQSEAHAIAYEQAQQLWNDLNTIKTVEIPGLQHARTSRGKVRSGMTRSLSVALLVLTLSVGVWLDASAPVLHFQTAIGERKTVTLADGSVVEINGNTEMIARLSWFRRDLTLKTGEALFSVSHEQFRPFTVTAGALTIRDIGTRFDVDHQHDGVRVAVIEGIVSLHADHDSQEHLLSAGFSQTLRDGCLQTVEAIDLQHENAWLDGRLVFKKTPLRQVAHVLTRYHDIEFVFTDPALANLTVSGRFDANDLKPFAKALERMFPIQVAIDTHRIKLSKR